MKTSTLIMTALAMAPFGVRAHADFMLTDKDNANGVTILSGNTASSTYIMETHNSGTFTSGTDGATTGFRFTETNGVSSLLTTPNAGTDLRQGVTQGLTGNAENGYVGTMLGKSWGNAITLSFDGVYLTNGAGADLYVTSKDVDANGVVQSTSTQDKSFAIGFHIVNGPNAGWHLYNPSALPGNFQPAEGVGNALGAIDLSDLVISSGVVGTGDLGSITGTMSSDVLIDHVILLNNNAQNAYAPAYNSTAGEFYELRDFDNADLDGDAFTGQDALTGRYGDRHYNGQDGPQAWFVGLNNTAPVPEPGSLALLGLGGLALIRRRRRNA